MAPLTNDALENARVEYGAAHDAYLHYDNFSWQVGSVLVAGAFVFWGFLLDKTGDVLVHGGASLVICLLMSVWLLYATHNREILFWKLHRVRELEDILGMEQHRRFYALERSTPQYQRHWPPGRVLDYFIFGLVSLGGPTLIILKNPALCYAWLPFLINALVVVLMLARVIKVDRSTRSKIRQMEKT